MVACHVPPIGGLVCYRDMYPAWVSNRWPFGLQAGIQSTEPHQPGLDSQHFKTWADHFMDCVTLKSVILGIRRPVWFVLNLQYYGTWNRSLNLSSSIFLHWQHERGIGWILKSIFGYGILQPIWNWEQQTSRGIGITKTFPWIHLSHPLSFECWFSSSKPCHINTRCSCD